MRCVDLFNFLYLEKLKSTCKHVFHCSHHSPSDVVWAIFCFSNENTPTSKNVKKLMTIFNDFFEETKNSRNSYQLRIERSSHSQMFFKIGFLGALGLKACKFVKKRLQHRYFAVKFVNFFRKLFFTETPPLAASELISTFWSCINTCFIFVIHISMSLE